MSTEGVETKEFNAEELYKGEFTDSDLHRASGMAKVIRRDGKTYVVLKELATDDGPDLHAYLATDDTAQDFIDLGPIDNNYGYDVEIEVDDNIDFTKYDTVLIWCQRFSVLFGEAALQ